VSGSSPTILPTANELLLGGVERVPLEHQKFMKSASL